MTGTERLILAAVRKIGVERNGFFGTLTFHFQDGQLSVIRREQTLKPFQLQGEESNFDAEYCD